MYVDEILDSPFLELDKYLDARDISVRQFAIRSGIRRGKLVKLIAGRTVPTPEEIEQARCVIFKNEEDILIKRAKAKKVAPQGDNNMTLE